MDEGMRDTVMKSLIDALGRKKVLYEEADLVPYSTGGVDYVVKVGEKSRYPPDFVVLPESTSEVQRVVSIAAEHKLPIIAKGGGSSLAGGLAPVTGGIVIDTVRMNRIVEVSKPNLCVTAQCGVTLKELEQYLAGHGLALNQMQGSFKVATVGGSISTIGFSRKHGKYGNISDRIMSLEVVLADGSVLRTGPKVLYTSTGYRLHQLFVGAEGTLGIITEATLRVEPIAEARAALLARYSDFYAALEGARRVKFSGVTYVGIEAFELSGEGRYDVPPGKPSAVLIDFEGTKEEVEAEVSLVKRILEGSGGILVEPGEAEDIVDGYQMRWCGLGAKLEHQGWTSFAPFIPYERLKEFFEKVWNEVVPKYGLEVFPASERFSIDYGRYEMAYVTFRVPGDSEGLENYEKAKKEIVELVTSLGGSIQACMSVGLKYRDYLGFEYSEVALDMMRRIKKQLDPDNIMNPGKKIPMDVGP